MPRNILLPLTPTPHLIESLPPPPMGAARRGYATTTITTPPPPSPSLSPDSAPSSSTSGNGGKKRLVVLGTGWGGYAFLKSLSYSTLRHFDVKVVSPTTSFSFTPLLAQAACGTLDFRSTIEPIHSNRWMEFHHAWCDSIDFTSQRIELTNASNPQFRLSDPLLTPPTLAEQQTTPEGAAGSGKGEREGEGGGYWMEYDYLVISVGSYNATFGTKGVKENALFLKDVSDARAIRWKILGAFERANAKFNRARSSPSSPSPSSSSSLKHTKHDGGTATATATHGAVDPKCEAELRDMLSFVVVGGGPTGSEFAAELHDLIKDDLSRFYPNLRGYPSIKLLDAGTTILSSFDKGLAEYAMKKFARDGIEVQLNAKISRVEPDAVYIQRSSGGGGVQGEGEEERVGAGMVVWSTGITTSPLIEALHGVGKEERSGKVLTTDRLNVLVDQQQGRQQRLGGSVLNPTLYTNPNPTEGGEKQQTETETKREKGEKALVALENVFAIGDCSSQINLKPPLPATAQVAAQKGSYLASLFNNHITPSLPLPLPKPSPTSNSGMLEDAKPFKFLDKGSMASIGGSKALIDTPVKKESGALAWILWRSAYTIMSMSWRNRFLVPANWASNLLFGRDVGRF